MYNVLAQHGFHLVHLLERYPRIVVAENMNLRRADADSCQFLLDRGEVIQVVADEIVAFHGDLPVLAPGTLRESSRASGGMLVVPSPVTYPCKFGTGPAAALANAIDRFCLRVIFFNRMGN